MRSRVSQPGLHSSVSGAGQREIITIAVKNCVRELHLKAISDFLETAKHAKNNTNGGGDVSCSDSDSR